MKALVMTRELAEVLRAVEKIDLGEAAAIANAHGRALGNKLEQLTDAGLVIRQAAKKSNRRRTTLFLISTTGRGALEAYDAGRCGSTPAQRGGELAMPRASVMSGVYAGAELQPYTGRPGAMAAFDLPSRMGNKLHYRDGRIVATEQTQ